MFPCLFELKVNGGRKPSRRMFNCFLFPLLLAVLPRDAMPSSPPQLDGRHLDITIVPEDLGYVDIHVGIDPDTGEDVVSYSGFLVDVLQNLAKPGKANFTYTLNSPSGFGSLCPPPIEGQEPYPASLRKHFGCGESDVTDWPRTNYTTDMYVGAYYVTSKRQTLNHFTIPLYPPTSGTLAMVGTATNIVDFDDLIQQQQDGKQKQACVTANTAYAGFVKATFPTLQIVEIPPGLTPYVPINDGTCDVHIIGHHLATSLVLAFSENGRCTTDEGKPIGIIGEPLGFGLNYIAFGIRQDLPIELVNTLNYWLLEFMTCSPNGQQESYCPKESLAVLFPENAGTGRECGYVQFPIPPSTGLSGKVVAGIVVSAVVIVVVVFSIVYFWKIRRQKQRFKKRFVQQIARNIDIGPCPSCIPVEKLAQEVQHIGNKDGTISKSELLAWMSDVKLDFISDKDFNALWSAMDYNNKGHVNAIDFFVFLSACGDEFEIVYEEQANMPKNERLKWAARRLSNLSTLGENGVRALQQKLERSSTQIVPTSQKHMLPLNSQSRRQASNNTVGSFEDQGSSSRSSSRSNSYVDA